MRQTASALIGIAVIVGWVVSAPPARGDTCWVDPSSGSIICEDGGGEQPPEAPKPKRGKRYLYVTVRAGFGECYYWSNRPGGVDTWDPANDPTVIDIVLRTPRCPAVPVVDAEATAWTIFRSWHLAAPSIGLEPTVAGITGLPTYLSSPNPAAITHTEVLPDGRTLRVRADITLLTVAWGDGGSSTHGPESAAPYPDGTVTHTYTLKTCTPEYRATHPSGNLCHPALAAYPITATYRWAGTYSAGGGWVDLGTLDRSTLVLYEVNEARGSPTG